MQYAPWMKNTAIHTYCCLYCAKYRKNPTNRMHVPQHDREDCYDHHAPPLVWRCAAVGEEGCTQQEAPEESEHDVEDAGDRDDLRGGDGTSWISHPQQVQVDGELDLVQSKRDLHAQQAEDAPLCGQLELRRLQGVSCSQRQDSVNLSVHVFHQPDVQGQQPVVVLELLHEHVQRLQKLLLLHRPLPPRQRLRVEADEGVEALEREALKEHVLHPGLVEHLQQLDPPEVVARELPHLPPYIHIHHLQQDRRHQLRSLVRACLGVAASHEGHNGLESSYALVEEVKRCEHVGEEAVLPVVVLAQCCELVEHAELRPPCDERNEEGARADVLLLVGARAVAEPLQERSAVQVRVGHAAVDLRERRPALAEQMMDGAMQLL
eukprot:766151-Hanusia_phi.AAC.1